MKINVVEQGIPVGMNPPLSGPVNSDYSLTWRAHPWRDVGGVLLHDPERFDEDVLPLHELPRFVDADTESPRKLLTTGGLSHVYDAGEYVVKVFDRPPDHQNILHGTLPDLQVNVTLARELERRRAHVGRWNIRNARPVAAFLGLEAMTDRLSLSHPQGCPASVWVLKKEAELEDTVRQPRLPSPASVAEEISKTLKTYRYDAQRLTDQADDNVLVTERPGFGWRNYGTVVLTGVFAREHSQNRH